MSSPLCERAIEDSLRHGRALLKFISANDVGLTGGHQSGFYLPKVVAGYFTPYAAQKGINRDHEVTIFWPDDRQTSSVIKWYGRETRSEYRLTRFGRGFPWRTHDRLGDLLVLIPRSDAEIIAYVLSSEDDIEEIQAALGTEVIESWALYDRGQTQVETEDECLNRQFRAFVETVHTFPEVRIFSQTTLTAILDCVPGFITLNADRQLLRLIREEYTLYRMVERKIYEPHVQRVFTAIDEFLATALSILQSRKSRAGRSLENHVEYLLRQARIPFEMRQVVDGTRPDIIIPGKLEYDDPAFPTEKLFMIGVKMTCRDRWRQVTREAPRIQKKHILTLQEGISSTQLAEMAGANVALVVPEALHKQYPGQRDGMVLSLTSFFEMLRTTCAR